MNELPPTSPNPSPSEPVSDATSRPNTAAPTFSSDTSSPLRKRLRLLTGVLLLLIVALVAQWWMTHTRMRMLQEEVARRLRDVDVVNAELQGQFKSIQELSKELQAKVSVLENKQSESQSQQLALEQLYQDLSKNRDDWALSEIEGLLSTASQQLELAGNVQGALIALDNADKSLSRADKPQFIAIRRAIAHDEERLKAVPMVDVAGIAVRLDNVVGQIDSMPLLSDATPVVSTSEPIHSSPPLHAAPTSGKLGKGAKETKENTGSTLAWLGAFQDGWQRFSSEIWDDFRKMVRIRQVNTPEALLLSPEQSYYVRENLKLRLLSARLALLSRNEVAFRDDLSAAQDTISRYFDTRSKQVQTAQALLKQVQLNNLSIQMPTLSESLNAVHNYKALR